MLRKKLDAPLAARVHGLEELAAGDAELAGRIRVKVLVHVIGDLDAAERAGLWTELHAGEIAMGTIAVGDLNRVAELDDVASVEGDRPRLPHLHTSGPEIRANHARAVPPGFNGRNVIVGVVDTGIDIFHHAFRKSDGKTRIVSLLDITLRQTISTTGNPTGGSIKLFWQPPRPPAPAGGAPRPAPPPEESTAEFEFPLTAVQVQTALEAFNSINPGDVAVTGGPLPGTPIVIDFIGRYDSRTFDSGEINALEFSGSVIPAGIGAKIVLTRGREFKRDEIDAALQTPNQPFLSRDTVGHGTHIAGIAAGDGSQSGNCHLSGYYVGVAPEADLVIVRSTLRSSANLQGINYVFDQGFRAPAEAKKPAVVSMSLGGQQGPHDGTDNEELALDGMLTGTTQRAIVVTAGNDGELYDHNHPELHPQPGGGMHAFKTVGNAPVTLGVVIQGGDVAMDEFDIWYAGAGRLSFNVTTPDPGGKSLPAAIAAGAGESTPTLAGHPLAVQSTLSNPPSGRHNIRFSISPPPGGQIAPGTWTITLRETQGTPTAFDCWISEGQRGEPHPRFINADQDRTRTINTPGTARLPVTIGAYNPADGALGEFSGRGPTTDGRRKPDLCAPGVGITAALTGARNTGKCCDCCVDFYKADNGTSVAAPHVAGVVALMFQANPALDHAKISQKLIATSRPPDPVVGPPLPNTDWGAGRVNAEAAVKSALLGAHAQPGSVEPVVLPVAAYTAAYLPAHMRVRELQRRVEGSATGQLVAALVSEHVDEVLRLIEANRRVALAWHRMHGPVLLRLLFSDLDGDVLLPRTFGGVAVADGLARMLDELARAGSPALQTDATLQRALMLALPGARLTDLDRQLLAS